MSKESYFIREPEAKATPLLVSIPHCGIEVPGAIAERFASPKVTEVPDTDWHLEKLYDFVPRLGARTIYARYSRYVVDLNRPADQSVLYPGRDETGLVPSSLFSGEAIYTAGCEPDAGEIAERVKLYWLPYHERLAGELRALKERFGYALLFDAHSIRSEVPRFFSGRLPGFMLGDVEGSSTAMMISAAVIKTLADSGISYRANDPFKGGYITRSHGRPAQHVHALQLEMSQRLYMEEDAPFRYLNERAQEIKPTLEAMLRTFLNAAAFISGHG